MDKTEKTDGISIERGKIVEKRKKGHFQYKVESATRKGIKSIWMESTAAYIKTPEEYEYNVGDEVNYFQFSDGRGMIVGCMTRDTD